MHRSPVTFTAEPSLDLVRSRCGKLGSDARHSKNERQETTIDRLAKGESDYRNKYHSALGECEKLRSLLADQEEVVEREPSQYNNNNYTPWFDGQSIKHIFKSCLKGAEETSCEVLEYISNKLGLNNVGQVTDEAKVEKMEDGIKELFDYHFANKPDMKKGEILGKSLLEGALFGVEAGVRVAYEGARTMCRTIFSGRNV